MPAVAAPLGLAMPDEDQLAHATILADVAGTSLERTVDLCADHVAQIDRILAANDHRRRAADPPGVVKLVDVTPHLPAG